MCISSNCFNITDNQAISKPFVTPPYQSPPHSNNLIQVCDKITGHRYF